MKILLTSLFLSLACLSSYAISDDGFENPSTPLNTELRKQLNKHMIAPIFNNEKMLGQVNVSFVVDTDGHILITELESDNDALASYVESRLSKIELKDNPDGFWKTSSISFVFNKE